MNSQTSSRLQGASAAQARQRGHSSGPAGLYAWTGDLEASRDVGEKDQASFAMILGWMERFRSHAGLPAGRESCTRFWKEQVLAKPREKWQLDQWGPHQERFD